MASHIGKLPVTIPAGVEVKIDGQSFTAKGAKGTDSYEIPEGITAQVEGNEIILVPADDLRPTRAKHGLARSIVASMVKGVHDGYAKTLDIIGTGYRAQAKGKGIEFSLGYSHTITVEPPEGIEFELPNPNQVIVKGIDKQAVGQCAANIRKLRAPEPYKGKGIEFSLGYSHTITVEPPAGIEFELPNPNQVIVKGIDKQAVGQCAANIRKLRAPEPYKGKGIKYADEHILRKAGKAGK